MDVEKFKKENCPALTDKQKEIVEKMKKENRYLCGYNNLCSNKGCCDFTEYKCRCYNPD